MQTVLEQGSIDKPLTFDVGLIQLGFKPQSVHLIHATFQSNCAEGLHFSAFITIVLIFLYCLVSLFLIYYIMLH